jgi:hypothetical protein
MFDPKRLFASNRVRSHLLRASDGSLDKGTSTAGIKTGIEAVEEVSSPREIFRTGSNG